ncbi:GGDEF domain-containing protein [Frankia sp. AgB1.9]|uniref:GGDEF domain-containing protein n=1 Tax=unclassified Frankia TaxID=2632575 RepID=UPI001934AF38|nr:MULTISPECIES: GGDEF domain-containing protein [unclassified Frankia]MBL7494238.1 GGDEF domain-containing protein [Frankia sp. AgW1.1]MBL7552455.1 GGDEF domain-containing protein [Frankia sp. AgB1.9]MBL7623557.1 GGDEF domain-containing protein [Frankia sp. AgB1.8]
MVGPRVASTTPAFQRPAGRSSWLFSRAAMGCVLLTALVAAFTVLLSPGPALIAGMFVTLASEVALAGACLWSARHARAGDRRWRWLIGVLAIAMAATNLVTTATLLSGGSLAARGSSAYLVLDVFYGLALAGLLCLPTYPAEAGGARSRGPRRWHAIIILDCALIVGSVVLIEWATELRTVTGANPSSVPVLMFSVIQQVGSLTLAVAVLLIASFRRPKSPTALTLLATGLLIYGFASSTFIYRQARGHEDLPAWSLILYTASILLMTLAALTPDRFTADPDGPPPRHSRTMWAHAMLPYLVLASAGLLIFGRSVAGAPLDQVETYGMVSLLVLALARQMFTIAENTCLLAKIQEREGQLHYQAFHDSLTGLANRALFTRQLQQAINEAAGTGGGPTSPSNPLAVLFMDLDHFKSVNDTYGHAAGDELLRIIAARLREGTRASDTVARLGGDEFAAILNSACAEDPRRAAERLATSMQAPCQLAGHAYTPRASLGLVTLDRDQRPTSPDALLHQADLAMYAAKRGSA